MKPALVLAVPLGLGALPATAQDTPQEFLGFVRGAPPPMVRVVVDPMQWEALTRSMASFGPPALRPDDLALIAAARGEQWSEVIDLVKQGRAAANAHTVDGDHALLWAARAGRDDVVRLLVQYGAELDRRGPDGFTPLGIAAFRGYRGTARLLLRAGALPERWGATGQGPLHLASMNDHVGVIDELLAAGLDPWSRNRAGDTALDVAAQHGQQAAMSRLIAAGVDPQQLGR